MWQVVGLGLCVLCWLIILIFRHLFYIHFMPIHFNLLNTHQNILIKDTVLLLIVSL